MAADDSSPPAPAVRLLRSDGALFVGVLPAPEPHAHHVLQVAVALRGRLRVEAPGHPAIAARGVVIASNAVHAVACPEVVGHFYLAPESATGGRLAAWLSGRPVLALSEGYARRAARRLRACWRKPGGAALHAAFLDLRDALVERAPAPGAARDPRVEAALARIARSPGDAGPLPALAREVGLSADRLRHLFRAQVGTSFRRYRRWSRLLRAIDALHEGRSITEAAHAAGFADAAHLDRTFRAAFTTSPTEFLRDSRFVQAPPEEAP